jgi:hypothetical protein
MQGIQLVSIYPWRFRIQTHALTLFFTNLEKFGINSEIRIGLNLEKFEFKLELQFKIGQNLE